MGTRRVLASPIAAAWPKAGCSGFQSTGAPFNSGLHVVVVRGQKERHFARGHELRGVNVAVRISGFIAASLRK